MPAVALQLIVVRDVLVICIELNVVLIHEPVHIVTILGAGLGASLDSTAGVNQVPTILCSTEAMVTSQVILVAAVFSCQIECLNAIDTLDVSVIEVFNYNVAVVDVTICLYQSILVIRISFYLLTILVDVLTVINTVHATASAVSSTGLLEQEVVGIAIQVNRYRTGLHRTIAVCIITEVVQVDTGLFLRLGSVGIHEIVQIIAVHIVHDNLIDLGAVFFVHLQCAQTDQHTTALYTVIRPEAIVFTFDLLDLTNYKAVVLAVGVVPSLRLVIRIFRSESSVAL